MKKNKFQPTRATFSKQFQCKSPLLAVHFFHFGSENGEESWKPPCTVYIKVERCQHIATTKTPQPPPPPCHLMAEKRKKNDSHFGILLISQSLYFQIIADLNIGWVAWAEARNNKVVIATRLCFTKSLHILSLLNAKLVCVFSDWKRIETEIDMPAM